MIRSTTLISLFVGLIFLHVAQVKAANVEVGSLIEKMFAGQSVETGSPKLNQRKEELEAFYKARSFKPIWVRDDGPKGKAKALLVELNRSIIHGLEPEFYGVTKLHDLMVSKKADELADLEMLFNGALIDYGYDLSNGHVDHAIAPDQVQVEPIIRTVTDIIEGAERAGNLREFVSSLLNVDERYVRLLTKIAEMNRASDAGLWPDISTEISELEIGDANPEITGVKKYLYLMGDFLPAEYNETPTFDRPLMQAVNSFQSRHGFTQSGKLDRQTLDEISMPIAQVVEKISINLERRRWQNREIGKKHVYVNLSDGQARLVIDDEKVGEFEIARLKSNQAIPTLYGEITHIQKPATVGALRLLITPLFFKGNQAKEYSLNLNGDPNELAKLISADTNFELGPEPMALSAPISIFVTYVTAWANKDGSVHFRQDSFGRDPILEKLLALQ